MVLASTSTHTSQRPLINDIPLPVRFFKLFSNDRFILLPFCFYLDTLLYLESSILLHLVMRIFSKQNIKKRSKKQRTFGSSKQDFLELVTMDLHTIYIGITIRSFFDTFFLQLVR